MEANCSSIRKRKDFPDGNSLSEKGATGGKKHKPSDNGQEIFFFTRPGSLSDFETRRENE